MSRPTKKAVPKNSPPPALFGSECGWAASAILLLCGVIGIWFTCLGLGDMEASALANFLRGQAGFDTMFGSSIFFRMILGFILGGIAGFVVVGSLPREQLARAKFEARIVLIILPVVLIYIPAMTASFIWDDDQEITANPSLRSLQGLWDIWAGAKSADYFPLKTTMLWIEFQLGQTFAIWNVAHLQQFPGGGAMNGFHIVNVLLHAVDAVLVWFVLKRLGIPGAWLAGLVFGIHPVHVESVGWIAERKNTLSTFFYLLALLSYFNFEDKNRARSYIAALVLFLAGLLCKTHVVVLPFVLILCAWWRHGFSGLRKDPMNDPNERRLMNNANLVIGALGIVGGISALVYLFGLNQHFHAVHESQTDPLIFASHMFKKGHLDREFWFLAAICIASGIVGMNAWFLGRMFNRNLARTLAFFQISVLLGAVTVWFQYGRAIGDEDIPIGALARRFANSGMAVWWYLWKALVPAHLITIYHRWRIDEPEIIEYVPLLALVAVMIVLWRNRDGWARIPFMVMAYFVVTLLPVLGFLKMSYLRLNTLVADHFQYISDISVIAALCAGAAWLWQKSPRGLKPVLAGAGALIVSAMLLYSWDRAAIYQGEETLWRDTLSKNDDTWQGHNHIGAVLFTQGKHVEATTHFARAVELKPDNPESHNNLGLGYCTQGNIEGGIVEYRRAVQIKGDEPSMRSNLANALASTAGNRLQKAQELSAKGDTAGAAEASDGAAQRFNEAIVEYTEVLKLDDRNPAVHTNIGVALMQTGRMDDAIAHFQRALELNPQMPQAKANLNAALQQRAGQKQ